MSPPELDQHEIELREFLPHLGDRREVDRGILADRGMRAAAGLDAGDALGRERAGAHQVLGVPLGVDVVGDGGDLETAAQPLAQGVHQRGLARADRAADADTQRSIHRHARLISRTEQSGVLGLVLHAGEIGAEGGAADLVE